MYDTSLESPCPCPFCVLFSLHPTAQEILTAAIGPISKHEYPYLLPASLCTLEASLAKKKKAGIPATVPTFPSISAVSGGTALASSAIQGAGRRSTPPTYPGTSINNFGFGLSLSSSSSKTLDLNVSSTQRGSITLLRPFVR